MIEAIVTKCERQGGDVVVLELAAANGAKLPPFAAGAHIDVEVAPGLVRQYSLCGDPARGGDYRIGVLRDPNSRGGSAALHATFAAGTRTRIGAPRNLFPLDPKASYSILVGGGIGVTPMIAMAHALHAAGQAFELHYCARSRARAAFLDELAAVPFAAGVHLHFDDEAAEQRFDPARSFAALAPGAHVYVCGPNGFMAWVRDAATGAGLPDSSFHQEFFTPAEAAGGAPFDVTLSRSGRRVTVGADETIVAALAKIGVKVTVSCEQGICGTCLCNVLEGEPEHRDSFLTDDEKAANDQIVLCCSRAKSANLVLDL